MAEVAADERAQLVDLRLILGLDLVLDDNRKGPIFVRNPVPFEKALAE